MPSSMLPYILERLSLIGLTAGVTGQQRMLAPPRHAALWIMITFDTLLTSLFCILSTIDLIVDCSVYLIMR
jgi:hypothetical protein